MADAHTEKGSVHLTVTDDTGRVVGAARLIVGEPWQLASLTFSEPGGGIVAAALCHGIVQALRVNRVRRFIATIDAPARAFLMSVGLLPTARSVGELLDRQRWTNPEGHRLVTQGQGLNDVELPYAGELLTYPAAARALAS